ncbi:hypothetical protein BB561_002051 [Smittium simulii]|uniref:Eukaryotic translation initiation factor 3 subunit D n=1 Tax=Smittium simulii TaxID=133385 RepID=A0A2T9YS08_9FUNG|nr:hypothetical protein BB561_002051 [Smittium simulii]
MSDLPSFLLPKILDAPISWGPDIDPNESTISEAPYTPFSKFDRIGKVADWASMDGSKGQSDNKGGQKGKQSRDMAYQSYGSNQDSTFAFQEADNNADFSLVDNRTTAAKKAEINARAASKRFNNNSTNARRNGMQRLGRSAPQTKQNQRLQPKKRIAFRRANNMMDYKKMQKARVPSIEVGKDWVQLQEIDFNRMNSLSFEEPSFSEFGKFGEILEYKVALERITPKNELPLAKPTAVRFNVTAIEDPVMSQIADENKAKVFVTDAVLTTLMTSTRSIYPWEIFVTRVGDKLYFDKRDNGPIDTLTVNENASDPPNEYSEKSNINSSSSLATEALEINNRIFLQTIDPKLVIKAENPNPFNSEDSEVLDDGCYVYNLFDLNARVHDDEQDDTEVEATTDCIMAVRSQIDAVVGKSIDNTIMIRALNQFDIKSQGAGGVIDWNTKFITQRGAIIATELKNNATKLGKWAFQAYINKISSLKLAFVTRSNPRNNEGFRFVSVINFKPLELINQLGFNPIKAWGIVKALTDLCLNLDEGRYVILRDPAKQSIRLYQTPNLEINTTEAETD